VPDTKLDQGKIKNKIKSQKWEYLRKPAIKHLGHKHKAFF
jgi:hypothetical protein